MSERWRIGSKYGIHVYEGDRPVATFQTVGDAKRAVAAVNMPDSPPACGTCPTCGDAISAGTFILHDVVYPCGDPFHTQGAGDGAGCPDPNCPGYLCPETHHKENDHARFDLRVSETDRGPDGDDGKGSRGGESLRGGAGISATGRPGQDLRDSRAPIQRHVGERGDHAPAGRDASAVGAGPSQPPAADEVVVRSCVNCDSVTSSGWHTICDNCFTHNLEEPLVPKRPTSARGETP